MTFEDDQYSESAHIIVLNSNQLSGTIPDWISNLTFLEELYLQANQLSGSIPDSLSNLSSMKYL
ncbi:hypothetical protein HDU76_003025, partial [Blyttiomyces sp. JEL0837]